MMDVVLKVEKTPNPNAVKFVLDCQIALRGPQAFPNKKSALSHPIAYEVFSIDGIDSVYLYDCFITVGKKDDILWEQIEGPIWHLLDSLIPPFLEEQISIEYGGESASLIAKDFSGSSDMLEALKKMEVIIEEKIRPYLLKDGGDIELIAFEDSVLYVRFKGACDSCPSSEGQTLKAIQEHLTKDMQQEIKLEVV